jgi:hypothetical protein
MTDAKEGKKKRKPSDGPGDFHARLRREKGTEEWQKVCARIKELIAQGVNQGAANWQAYREFGYLGAAKEAKLRKAHEAQHGPVMIEDRPNPKEFDDALARLSTNPVDQKIEIAWIRNHPAMCRKARQDDNTKPVKMTADDIKDAPSRAAAIQLQNWADNPREFNKNAAFLLKRLDENAESAKDSEYYPDPNLDDVKRMLKEAGRP